MKLDFLSLAAARVPGNKRAGGARSYATTSDASHLIAAVQPPTLSYYYGSCSGSVGCWNFTVNDLPSGYKQTVDGYGAAITDATVAVLSSLGSSQKQAAFDDLFGTAGNRFNLMRHTIGSSDLSATNYTYDDSGVPDISLAQFSLGAYGTAMLNFMKQVKSSYPATKFLGSGWSAPGWMKLNHVQTGTTVNNNLNASYSASYANYLVKYLQTYKDSGLNIDAITIQNEPLNSKAGFPTMYIDQYQATDLTGTYIGPALKAAGLSTQIWAYDHNTDVPQYPQTVLNGASSYVGAVGWHCYAASSNSDWNTLTNFHNSNPSVAQYMTECWTSPTNTWYSTPDFCMAPLQNYAAGIIAWNMASDSSYGPHIASGDACQTCRGLIVVQGDGTYSKTLDYYMMGQFSRFTARGSIVIDTQGSYDYGGGSKFESVSFLNGDNTRTVVIESLFGNDVMATVSFSSGEAWTGLVLAKSVTTWVLPPTTGTKSSPAASTSAMPDIVPNTTSNGATLVNCFGDNTQYRSLSNRVNDVQTVEDCVSQCQAQGYALAGVEYTFQCFCDNYISVSPIAHSRCAQYSCQGNSTETCGGDNAIQVYKIAAQKSSTTLNSTGSSSSATSMPSTTSSITSSISSSSKATLASASASTSTSTLNPTSSSSSSSSSTKPMTSSASSSKVSSSSSSSSSKSTLSSSSSSSKSSLSSSSSSSKSSLSSSTSTSSTSTKSSSSTKTSSSTQSSSSSATKKPAARMALLVRLPVTTSSITTAQKRVALNTQA